tara:strand:+ start:902 stop:1183 length:282 start_codon:yes stop_codon:yes gene_type:complete
MKGFGQDTNRYQGFRMIAGKATETDEKKVAKSNICHRCWTSSNEDTFVGGAPCSGTDTVGIPMDTKCKMIRQTIIFPTYVTYHPRSENLSRRV